MMRRFSLAARIKYRMEFSERILNGSNPAEATPRPVAPWGLTQLNADLNWLNVALSFASRSSNGAGALVYASLVSQCGNISS
jgi:hypothetical protein